ncbi:hypothetical protein E4U13_003789 [Claviceps humidiphila]|uniref:Peptidase A1 domain-containing protein n=1 Tax=Claviceps humidiphila TaxID=1294629 RepID=A0A9P7PZ26_9HYPO|nr:hypothetical protein E4U13_003789 [Claviceps humidiphila]
MVSSLLSLAVLPLVAQAIRVPMDNKMRQEPGMLRYPITVNPGAPSKHIHRRQQDVAVHAQQSGFFYSIELQVGTPPQPVSVNFDTGSAELWINPVCSKSTDPASCQSYGRFNGSQTYVDTNITNRINYGTGFAQLEYGYDYVQIGSARLSQQLFGVATDSEFAVTGIMGAGPQLKGWSSDYPMILDNMVSQKFIKSRAFSLDIRSIESARGSVVFGGIDTKKFSGYLEKRPIIPAADSPDKLTRYWVYLDGVSITKNDASNTVIFDQVNGQPVLLDSGYTVSSLSTDHFNKIKDAFPGVTPPPSDDNSGLYRVPCNVGQQNGTVNFKFGKTEINVPFNDFIWKQSADLCVLGVIPDDKFPVLGDTFLRAAYVVYDMDNRQVHIGNNEDCGSSLLAIGSGPDAVPSVQGDCGKPVSTSSSTQSATTTTMASSSAPMALVNTTTTAISTPMSLSLTNATITTSSSEPASTSASTTRTIAYGSNSTIINTSASSAAAAQPIDGSNTSLTQSDAASASTLSLLPAGSNNTAIHTSDAATTTGNQKDIMATSSSTNSAGSDSNDSGNLATELTAQPTGSNSNDSGNPATEPMAQPTGSNSNDSGNLATDLTAQPTGKPFPTVPTMARYNDTNAGANATTLTLTYTTTRLHTITACPAYVTNCPVGSVTTETIVAVKTWCPGNAGKTTPQLPAITPMPSNGVPSCPGPDCQKGKVTKHITSKVYVCPESTAVFTVPLTHDCMNNEAGCKPGDKVVNTYTVTIEPHVMIDKPTPIPGCGTECIMPPAVQTLPPKTGPAVQPPAMTTPAEVPQSPAGPAPTADIGTITGFVSITTAYNSPPVTAGAATSSRMSAVVGAVVLGALAMVAW